MQPGEVVLPPQSIAARPLKIVTRLHTITCVAGTSGSSSTRTQRKHVVVFSHFCPMRRWWMMGNMGNGHTCDDNDEKQKKKKDTTHEILDQSYPPPPPSVCHEN